MIADDTDEEIDDIAYEDVGVANLSILLTVWFYLSPLSIWYPNFLRIYYTLAFAYYEADLSTLVLVMLIVFI